jgi:steroid delta-isomerase-like uncharacterized protein
MTERKVQNEITCDVLDSFIRTIRRREYVKKSFRRSTMYSQIKNISIACIILIALGGFSQTVTAQTEENKAIMLRAEEFWNTGDMAIADEVYAAELVNHDPTAPDVCDLESLKGFAVALRAGMPDFHVTNEYMIAEGDKVVGRWTATGIQTGEFFGVPPTGIQATCTGISIYRFVDGKVVEAWWNKDMAGLMEQLGVIPVTREDYTWGVPSEVTGDPGDTESNKAIFQYMFDEVFGKGNLDVIDEVFAADFIMHDPVSPIEIKGPEGYKQLSSMYFIAFPDLQILSEDIIAGGDKVASRWTLTGTHKGDFMGIPATGRQITTTGVSIFRFADGKIVETWASYDALGMIQQLTGPLPIPEDLVVDQITSPSLEGNPLGDPATRNMVIYLPPGYETSGIGYPVVYLMPGLGASERWWACGEFSPAFSLMGIALQSLPEGGFASMIDGLIADGKMQPMILVMPDISTAYGGSFCVNSALNGNHEDYIVNEIVPYIDANYRTLPSRDSRGIAGHCMGGYAAMYLTMRHPDVFGAVASHSGTLLIAGLLPDMQQIIAAENPEGLTLTEPDPAKPWTGSLYLFSAAFSPNLDNPPFYMDLPFDENVQIREEVAQRWATYDLLQIFPDYVSALASLRGIYLDAGDKDEIGEQLIAQAFSGALSAAGIEHQLEIFDGAHMDKLYTQLAESLSYLSDVLVH